MASDFKCREIVSLRVLPKEKISTNGTFIKFPAWADFVQGLPAGRDSLLYGDFCQLNLTFLLEQFMADVFLDHTEASLNCGREGGREGVLPGLGCTE